MPANPSGVDVLTRIQQHSGCMCPRHTAGWLHSSRGGDAYFMMRTAHALPGLGAMRRHRCSNSMALAMLGHDPNAPL